MAIHLVTFGGLRAVNDTGELRGLLSQHTRAALLVYLAVDRRVSRELLTTIFWPESDAENARHALRQSLYHLRKTVGAEWVESHPHELIATDDVRSDAHDFMQACARRDHSAALELYRGPFLDGIHLVDLQPWESWVDARRTQFARAFRSACRDLLDARHAAGDWTGLVNVAEQWVARDASDAEAQHRLIEALSAAGDTTEAIRQYETFARALEVDGLEPAAETRALAERLKTSPGSLPQSPTVASTPIPAPDATAIAAVDQSSVRRHSVVTGSPRHPGRRLGLLAVAGVAVALVGAWALRQRTPDSASPVSPATTIAVLPFDVRGGLGASFLREGMVNLLATALDGGGAIRSVDPRATFAAVAEPGDSAPALPRAHRIARQLGADMFVLGNVTAAGGRLQIEAAIYGSECGRRSGAIDADDCKAPDPVTRAVATGSGDSVFALVDGLAAQLLGGLGSAAADRLRQTAGLTTSSLAAFKTYLQGEDLMRQGQFERAAETYQAALHEDSTFALAHYRLALAREWAPLPGEDSAAAAAARHAHRLAPRDRRLLDAFRQWRFGDATSAERAYRAILARYPEDVDAWFQLGEILFHHGPLLGRPIAESEGAWRKVLAYEPGNLFAITHVARIALITNRVVTVDSLLALFDTTALRTDRRLAEIVLLRAAARKDTAEALAVARDVRRWEPFAIWRTAVFLTAFTPDARLMRRVFDELLVGYPNPGLRADLYWFASMLDLAAGHHAASRTSLATAIESERQAPRGQQRSAYGQVTEWHAATLPLSYPDSMVRRVRNDAVAFRIGLPGKGMAFVNELGLGTTIQLEPLRHYVIGILSARLRDTTALSIAADSLQRFVSSETTTALTRDLDRGLRALRAHIRGQSAAALQVIESLEVRDSQGDVNVTPFVTRINERVLHGDILAALGRTADAQRWFASLGDGSVSEIPMRTYAATRLAQLGSVARVTRR